jgi:filamentous hemagglutinin family protein
MKYIFIRPQKLISIGINPSHDFSLELLVRSLVITLSIFSGLSIPVSAQIIYEGGKAATQAGNTIDIPISEGKPTPTGANLFHSFDKFNVNTGQTANFISTPGIQNILGRVNGANGGSLIDGKLQVTGGNANLFLMNPAGIVFGKGASLDINGAFTATTAKAIDFGNGNWFNAVGANTYSNLNGNPLGLAFTGGTPGSIFNAATLSNAQPGKSITLVGGTVISTGDIKTAGGNISISTIKGGQYVQIKADGSLLRLDLPASANNIAKEATAFTPLKLAELLTSPTVALVATGVTNENGVVKLVGDNRSILPGDIITQKLNTSGDPNGGVVSLNTQAGDIIVNSIDTSSQGFGTGGNGGDATINAGGIFRATGFTAFGGNISAKDKNGNPVGNSGVSIFTGGNRDFKVDEKDLRGGKINITYQGKLFVVGGEAKIDPDPKSITISVVLTQPFVFPEGASGAVGAIVSRNSNGNLRVVLKDGVFTNQDGSPAGGFGIAGGPVIPRGGGDGGGGGGGGKTANPDQQASRPKAKENCTPSSTAVASNPTAAPTRSAGNPNAVSADPCQSNTSNNEILQILTDRE